MSVIPPQTEPNTVTQQYTAPPPEGHTNANANTDASANANANANPNANANANANVDDTAPAANNDAPADNPANGNTDEPAPEDTDPTPNYVPIYFDGQLPAPTGNVAKTIARLVPIDVQRNQTEALFNFLHHHDIRELRDLNEDKAKFCACLVNMPHTHKVRLVYGLGIGTATFDMGNPIQGMMLCLSGDGSPELGPPLVKMFDQYSVALTSVKCPPREVVRAAFEGSPDKPPEGVAHAHTIQTNAGIFHLVPVPPYMFYDAICTDIDAAIAYERLHCSAHQNDEWWGHAKDFLSLLHDFEMAPK